MSVWISVYCQKPIEKFRSSTLDRLIKRQMPDWAEYFPMVKVTEYRRAGADILFHLNYRISKDKLHKNSPLASVERVRGGVPIVIDVVSESTDVTGYVQEQLEEHLKRRRGEGVKIVRDHLANVTQIFSLCLKQCHCDDAFGRSIAYAAAEGLAREGMGIFHESYFGWLKRTRSGNQLILKDS